MARFTKYNSNYIKTNRHQHLKDGTTIFERDWVTIGSQLHFGPNKIPYYNSGNFLFTTSRIPFYYKKYKNGVQVGVWTYADVENATSQINQIHSDEYSEDIRTYVYYGSCVELVRSSIENIINWFPGNITISNDQLSVLVDDKFILLDDYYIVNNPFAINTYHYNVQLTKNDNVMRYLSYSWDKYIVKWTADGEFANINTYKVITRSLYEKIKNGIVTEYQMFSDNEYNELGEEKELWQKSKCRMRNWLPFDENKPRYEIIIDNERVIECYIYEGENIELSQFTYKDLVIQPKEEIITEYFNSLQGFEKLLLNRKSKPLYSNQLITPIEYSLGYKFFKRTYMWPSNDYCIDITSVNYIDFLNKLTSMAELFDEICSDNLWKRMTHEAIKNYDWTYSKEFEEGDEEDNIEGGERMHKVINIIARIFDDIKRNIDLVKKNNRITYDGDRNIPNALLSDKLELLGWSTYSTIPTYEEQIEEEGEIKIKALPANNIKIQDDFLQKYNINWYNNKNNKETSFEDVDIEFMRRLILSSKYILQSKGTRKSIDMVMGMFGYGNEDYTITEEYRIVKPVLYYDAEEVEDESFGEKIVRLNNSKEIERLYDDDVSGIPVGSFNVQTAEEDTIVNTTFLIPFYDQNKIYDGNFVFQSNGGWGYNGNEDEEIVNSYGWSETLSYLHVMTRIEDLLDVNPNDVNNGDIYYVSNIDDYTSYSESDTLYSKYFVLNNDYAPDLFSSWTNIDLSGESYTRDKYTEEEIEKYNNYIKKVLYLDSIIPYNIGNNPHTGYGWYDKGEMYFKYMEQPFKYSIDRHFFDYEDEETAKEITFDISKITTENLSDKIQIFADTENGIITYPEYDGITYGGKKGLFYKEYNKDAIQEKTMNEYYLNSKVIYIKNNKKDKDGNYDEYYKKYFKSFILKYLMQVIPSTAILILQGFESNE